MSLATVLAGSAGALSGLLVADLLVRLAGMVRFRDRQPFRLGIWPALRKLMSRAGPRLARLRAVRRLAPPADLSSRISAAGQPGGLGVREWISIKAGFAAAVGLLAAPVAASSPGRLGIAIVGGAPLAGFFIPDFWLGRAARMRAESAVRELPDMLDLLRVAIAAGMAPSRAIGAVATRFDGPLAREWHRVAAAITLGTPADSALEQLARRLPAPAVRSFVEVMRGASRHGLALSEALTNLASSARHARQQRLREQAARAGPKIQLVVAVVLVPSVMLVIAAGLASELGGSGIAGP